MEKIKLVDICNPKQWKTIPTGELLDNGYPVYGANGVIGFYNEYNHENPVVAITCRGATCGSVNITEPKAYVTGNAMCLDDVRNDIDIEYLYYFLKHYDFKGVISGSAQPQITRQGLEKVILSICSPDEQRSIIDKLKKIEVIIKLRELELNNLDELIKARFVEMFGDPVSNSFGLPVKKLSDLGSLDRGRSQHRPRNAPELLGGPYPLIQTGEVSVAGLYITEYHNTYSEIGLKQSKMWKAGTLCITIAANIAQTAIMTFDACFPDSVVGFVPYDEVNALYIHYWFSFFQKILEDQAPQVAQKNINLKILSNLNIVVPEKKTLKLFEDFVAQVDKSKVIV